MQHLKLPTKRSVARARKQAQGVHLAMHITYKSGRKKTVHNIPHLEE